MLEIFKNLGMGFSAVANIQSLLWILIGVCVGILGGAIPGISPSMAVALLLPMTYALSPTIALIMLMGIYIGANYGGSITAVAVFPLTTTFFAKILSDLPKSKSRR